MYRTTVITGKTEPDPGTTWRCLASYWRDLFYQ